MTVKQPLSDSWFYWDPERVNGYPHTSDPESERAQSAPGGDVPDAGKRLPRSMPRQNSFLNVNSFTEITPLIFCNSKHTFSAGNAENRRKRRLSGHGDYPGANVNPDTIEIQMTATDPKRGRRDDESTLAGRLRKRRKDIGWTQVQLAEEVGTSQAVIQKIENGKSLRPRIMEDLAVALDVLPSWLMFGVEEVPDLDGELLELARAWSNLPEPHRSAMRDAIFRMRHGKA
jgi:transcriptional regulator with XRE-family HTH domain